MKGTQLVHSLGISLFLGVFLSSPGFAKAISLAPLLTQSQSKSQPAQPLPVQPVHPIQYEKRKVGRAWIYLVRVKLQSPKIRVSLHIPTKKPAVGLFPHEPFSSLIEETHPVIAIDGTYYDTKTFRPVGTLVEKGAFLGRGTHGIAVCFDAQNSVTFQKVSDFRNFPWKKYQLVLSTGPTLVRDSHIYLYPREEKFRDPDLFHPARRSALGVTPEGDLLLVATRQKIHLRDIAWIMKELGADQAVSLDGGSSTALYYRGKYLIRPARVLTNVFLVYEQKEIAQEKVAAPTKE